ncbi:MAG: YicC/YloC family endoribonuclease [Desulfitobacteriaceae bacterium]
MANSMTGFGRGEASGQGYQFTVELKAVNHRFLEVVVRLPKNFMSFEEPMRKMVQEKLQRGRVEIYINIAQTEEKKRLAKVDKELALSYDKSLKELALSLHTAYEVDIYRLAALPEVLSLEEAETDLDKLWPVCAEALAAALEHFVRMRAMEGLKLTEDLLGRLDFLAASLEKIEQRSDSVVADYQKRLRERVQALLGETVLDEARLANEVAFFADRASITEEIVRFHSHLEQSKKALKSSDAVGRKLDFLIQEMNREINTIGSKANDLGISQVVIDVKSELEKVREQVQNLE